jgi:hypothetical protein
MHYHYYLLTTPKGEALVLTINGRVIRIGGTLRGHWCGKEVTLLKRRAAAQNWSLVSLKLGKRRRQSDAVLAAVRARLGKR